MSSLDSVHLCLIPQLFPLPLATLCVFVCMCVYLLSPLYKLFDATEIGLIGI